MTSNFERFQEIQKQADFESCSSLCHPKSVKCPASISENPVPLCQIFSLVKKIFWNYLTFIYHKMQHKALIISFNEFWNHWIKFKWIKCFWQKGQWAWVLHSKKVAKNDKKEPLYMFKMHCLYYIAINATNNCWFFLSFFLKLALKKTYINLVIKSLDILRKAKKIFHILLDIT